jgi:CubicO group peptidase (beta-lactamase class C family)
VTIHDLLTHTSGLTYGFFGRPHLADAYARAGVSDGLVQTEGTTGENASKLARLPLLHQPGSAWEYGLSTDVLGHVIEVVSRMSLERFFEQRIFVPLRMADTHFFLPAAKRPRLAALYTPGPDKKVRRVGDEPVRLGHLTYSASFHYLGPRTYFSGGAGLVSTVPDYARFLEMLRRGGELDGVRVLSRESVELMTRNQIGELVPAIRAHGDTFGYGVGVVSAARTVGDASLGASTAPSPSPGTYSWGGIFNTFFLVDPQREVVAILMTQVYPFDHLSLRDDFKRLVYEALAEAGTPRLEPANRLER